MYTDINNTTHKSVTDIGVTAWCISLVRTAEVISSVSFMKGCVHVRLVLTV